MQVIKTEDAVGHVLCHDLTQIIRGEYKDARFRKGHIVTKEDIPVLLSMGKENLYVFTLDPGMVHENDAAERLIRLCRSEHMERGAVKEGKIELFAGIDGLFTVDADKLNRINLLEQITVATRRGDTAVKRGDKLCGARVIPLVIEDARLCEAEQISGGAPILSLLPYLLSRAGIVTTGSEVFHGRIRDAFTPVVVRKLAEYGIETTQHTVTDDSMEHVTAAIEAMKQTDVELILCTGGMSVDPDDNTPGAIKNSGAQIVTYGAPVLPGAMFLLGYFGDGRPVMGLPGCVMYAGASIFDLVLPRVAAGVRLTKQDFAVMGNGGLCLGCKPCTYPHCPFGR